MSDDKSANLRRIMDSDKNVIDIDKESNKLAIRRGEKQTSISFGMLETP